MASLPKIVCLVTGGASGLGRATAQRLIRNGARVVIADLPKSDGDNAAKELGEDSCYFSPTDVSNSTCLAVQKLFRFASVRLFFFDLLVLPLTM